MTAVSLRALPRFDLLGMINLSQVEGRSAAWASFCGRARIVKLTVNDICVAGGVPKDARAVAPFACVVRADLFQILFEHHPLHRSVVQIAEGRELLHRLHEQKFFRSVNASATLGINSPNRRINLEPGMTAEALFR